VITRSKSTTDNQQFLKGDFMADELAVQNETKSVHLVARSPQEMAAAQEDLGAWLTAKVAAIDQEVSELKAATEAAIQNGWQHQTLAGQLSKARQQHVYYAKMLQAVKAGYCIIPNFPIDVFAIRVTRQKPSAHAASTKYSYQDPGRMIADEQPQLLPAGQGRYVSPQQTVKRWNDAPIKDEKGNETIERWAKPVNFGDISFPLIAAQSVVMNSTQQAMALQLFDAIGICPESRPKGDPMIIGQIRLSKSRGSKMASFIIAWHLDVRTL
jgi:hypothetical protein